MDRWDTREHTTSTIIADRTYRNHTPRVRGVAGGKQIAVLTATVIAPALVLAACSSGTKVTPVTTATVQAAATQVAPTVASAQTAVGSAVAAARTQVSSTVTAVGSAVQGTATVVAPTIAAAQTAIAPTVVAAQTQIAPTRNALATQAVATFGPPVATSTAASPVQITAANVSQGDTTVTLRNSGTGPVNVSAWLLMTGTLR